MSSPKGSNFFDTVREPKILATPALRVPTKFFFCNLHPICCFMFIRAFILIIVNQQVILTLFLPPMSTLLLGQCVQ